jgi:3-keto-disaccharide hydrolase
MQTPNPFHRRFSRTSLVPPALLCGALMIFAADQKDEAEPKVIDPGPPPSDAIVLFDGKDLSRWRGEKGEAKWKLLDGVVEVNGTGSIITKEEFGDCQLHIEWAAPAEVKGNSQERGNSGVYFQGRYEIQVLDSYNNKTYSNGQAGAFYGHNAPLVNASGKPGEWQTYDIIFHAPKKRENGEVEPGSFTVFHNSVLVQDHIAIKGDATTAAKFKGVTPKGPLVLQDHGNPVRYRNIWIRPLN